jgi:hypothetical protein
MPKFPLNLSTGMQFVAAQTEKCITSTFVHQAEQQSSSHDILQGHLFGMLYRTKEWVFIALLNNDKMQSVHFQYCRLPWVSKI